MQADLTINYVIVLPEDPSSDFSFVQGFSESLLKRMGRIRTVLSLCSPNILELCHLTIVHLRYRIDGRTPFRVFPMQVDSLTRMVPSGENPFWVTIVDSETKSLVTSTLR